MAVTSPATVSFISYGFLIGWPDYFPLPLNVFLANNFST
jgi:hypothetical protein